MELPSEIKARWIHILQNGVSEKNVNCVLGKYGLPDNCGEMQPFLLTPELQSS